METEHNKIQYTHTVHNAPEPKQGLAATDGCDGQTYTVHKV